MVDNNSMYLYGINGHDLVVEKEKNFNHFLIVSHSPYSMFDYFVMSLIQIKCNMQYNNQESFESITNLLDPLMLLHRKK